MTNCLFVLYRQKDHVKSSPCPFYFISSGSLLANIHTCHIAAISPVTSKSEQLCQSENTEEDHFILNFNQTIFWLRIADIIAPISKGECQVDTVIAIIEQISAQLMQLAGTLTDADVTTKILVALCVILIFLWYDSQNLCGKQ